MTLTKYICLAGIVLLGFQKATAQILHPVHWSYATKKIAEDTYEVYLKADIDEGWHTYAQVQPKNAVATPTKIVFNKMDGFKLVGKVKEIGRMEKWESKETGITAHQYSKAVDFVQTVKIKAGLKTVLGTITFQTCTDKKCLPAEDVPFAIPIK